MGRVKIEINKVDLVKVLQEVESKQKFNNRTDLYAAICETQWAKDNNLKPQVCYMRMREYGIEPTTPKGKKGFNGIGGKGNSVPKIPRAEKFAKDPLMQKHFTILRNSLPKGHKNAADKIAQGSMKEAIKTYCKQCMNFNLKEITNCELYDCALWAYRPFQTVEVIEEDNK